MIGKRAKILSPDHVEDLLVFARQTRHPIRNQVLVLLSVKAGLRAAEIAGLTWPMAVDPAGKVGGSVELRDMVAKKGRGRIIPIHPELRAALLKLANLSPTLEGSVIRSERGGPMSPVSIVCWFANAYRIVGLDGCSSHSGRRAALSLLGPPGWSTMPVLLCAMSSSWRATGQSRPLSGTSTVIPTPSASWCR